MKIWGKRVRAVGLAGMMGVLAACGAADTLSYEMGEPQSVAAAESTEDVTTKSTEETVTGSAAETALQETQTTELSEPTEAETEESMEEAVLPSEIRLPAGHRIIYSDGEVYGWTRYEYDEWGRKDMVIFITPTGNEYWSPVYYDGNGHAIPETVGDWVTLDENGLYLEVGAEDSRGRRTPTAEYVYDEKGNLTDYWYMYDNGRYLRHVVYQYDSKDRLVREEVYNARYDKLLSYIIYTFNSQGNLIRKNEVEDADEDADIAYTMYRYDEEGRLSREEKIWGGRVHDYVEYTYNQAGELLREYHYLEDPMMGGPYTVEYLFEDINDSAG